MMMRMVVFILLLSVVQVGQSQTYATAKESDPKAKAILDKLKASYDGYKTMEVKFEVELEIPNRAKELQKGSLIQDGKKFVVKMADQDIYCDGINTWLYLKKNKEVQITTFDPKGSAGVMSPKQLVSLYNSGEYVYAIAEERKVGTQTFTDIEFKPLKKKSEFSKIRITIDKKQNKMVSLRVFSKDGTRYLLKVSDIIANRKYEPATFVFNAKSYPGVHIEDLRMD
jgi:outer membrane lipoprotein-sorting protein